MEQKKRLRKDNTIKSRLATMAISLIGNKEIIVTEPKAKALFSFMQPLIIRAIKNSPGSRSIIYRALRNNSAVDELLNLAVAYKDSPRNHIRITSLGMMHGDKMCKVQFVDTGRLQPNIKKTRRRVKKTETNRIENTTQDSLDIIFPVNISVDVRANIASYLSDLYFLRYDNRLVINEEDQL